MLRELIRVASMTLIHLSALHEKKVGGGGGGLAKPINV